MHYRSIYCIRSVCEAYVDAANACAHLCNIGLCIADYAFLRVSTLRKEECVRTLLRKNVLTQARSYASTFLRVLTLLRNALTRSYVRTYLRVLTRSYAFFFVERVLTHSSEYSAFLRILICFYAFFAERSRMMEGHLRPKAFTYASHTLVCVRIYVLG